MARPRKKERRGWPEGLRVRRKPSGTYYYFDDPVTKREIPLGSDLQAALKGVRLVQTRRAPDPVLAVVAAIEQPVATVRQHVDWFLKNRLAEKRLADSSRAVQVTRLEKLCRLLGPSRSVATLTPGLVNAALDAVSMADRNRYRALAIEVLRSAVARSLLLSNPAEHAERAVALPVRQRARLSAAHYAALLAVAEPWLRRAMELQRLLLARPDDLCALRVGDWDGELLRLAVGKTDVHLEIEPHAELRAALLACAGAVVPGCDRLVCRPPVRRLRADERGNRGHAAALTPGMLRDAFARLWPLAGLPDDAVTPWYEIKSRGVDDYLALGWPLAKVQGLIGHGSLEMTRHYADGHGVRWTRVALA